MIGMPGQEFRRRSTSGDRNLVRGSAVRRVLVVIPTLNERANLEQVYQQLRADLPPGLEVKFVIVDGGSTDGTIEVAQRLVAESGATLLHNPNKIQSVAVNLAARRLGSDADVLIRADAHAGYPSRFCEALVRTLEKTRADAVVVPMDSVGTSCLQKAIAWVSNSFLGNGGAAHRAGKKSGFVDHGHHAAFRMEAFRAVGGYEETFTHNEDAELDCRQRALGARIYLDAQIRVSYQPRTSLAALAEQYFKYGQGRCRTMRRHPGSWRLRQLAVPLHFVLTLMCLALAPVLPLLLLYPLAYLLALVVLSVALALTRRSLCGLAGGVAAFVLHFSWAAGFLIGWLRYRENVWQPEAEIVY